MPVQVVSRPTVVLRTSPWATFARRFPQLDGAFSAGDLELMELFSAQASVAIKNARLVASLRENNGRMEQSRQQIESSFRD